MIIKNRLKRLVAVSASQIYQNFRYDLIVNNSDFYDLKIIDLVEKIAKSRRAYLSTERNFYKDLKNNDYSVFRPIDSLEKKIEERTNEFTKSTIGIHIRRGDNEKSALHSPLSLFESAIAHEISINPRVNFYVASDSEKEKRYLKQVFGNCIITSFEKTSRLDIEGMQSALIDLYALSRTCKIYGSYWSSFSRVAADISGIDLTQLVISSSS